MTSKDHETTPPRKASTEATTTSSPPTIEAPGVDLDYFSFVELAGRRLDEEIPDNDSGANRVILTLSRAASQIVYDLEASVHRPNGHSWASFRLMFVLWLAGPMESGRTASLAGMSRAAVSNLANTLTSRGLLRKVPGTADRRAITLSLTKSGLDEVQAAFREQNQRETLWVSSLTPIEQQLLIMLLEKMMGHRDIVGARSRQ
ncbi:putative transcriptional regulator, MarR family [Arthrobacter sp. PAMC 25486]|uniref:MarR family winged helix-turn-helix transcriptional regulator n=1 Tax=Arthrobacter sp. PAMC 25486 TaxID=1494608 RepID=UPI000535DE31|nr:MarR family winged helix-turn-helix transcriptional regulator [Arthrobacter sp. PAMC 25486]AIY03063.1 putative transcriptional regulator, MarR family [Arthrobacter sp. PAMC 25486]